MDTVKGKRTSRSSLLVLTERKTREELIYKLEENCAEAVVQVIDALEEQFKEKFKDVFKSITCDNGTEFSFGDLIEKSKLNEGNRTSLYYCHPYSSFERGSNEVDNKMIRRHIPKYTCFDNKLVEDIKGIETWINNYPRKMFEYKSSLELFALKMANIP